MDGKISTLMNMNSEHQGYLKNLIAPGNDPSKKKFFFASTGDALLTKLRSAVFPWKGTP